MAVMMTLPLPEELFFSGGCVVQGVVRLIGRDGEAYLLSPGDELHLMVRDGESVLKADDVREQSVLKLTYVDECAGRYPFLLTSVQTSALAGKHFYYFAVHFADGEVYPVTPMALMQSDAALGGPAEDSAPKVIFGRVPRRQTGSVYVPGVNQLEALVAALENGAVQTTVASVKIDGQRICLLSGVPEGVEVKPSEVLRQIHRESLPGEEPPWVAGWFHRERRPELEVLMQELSPALAGRFVDVERLMKQPVTASGSRKILSTAALEVLGRSPSEQDIEAAQAGQYPPCLMKDDHTWNDSGCRSAALLLLKEVFANGK